MNNTPTNTDDMIDSRDVIARIEELEAEIEEDGVDGPLDEEDQADAVEELTTLKALAKQGEDSPDWAYGETLIRDSYFRDYAQELAEGCDMLEANSQWPARCIDWDQAADELQTDYFSIEFDGVDYWIRA